MHAACYACTLLHDGDFDSLLFPFQLHDPVGVVKPIEYAPRAGILVVLAWWWFSFGCSQTDKLVVYFIREKLIKMKVEGNRLEPHTWRIIWKLARDNECLSLKIAGAVVIHRRRGDDWIDQAISLEDQTELTDLKLHFRRIRIC